MSTIRYVNNSCLDITDYLEVFEEAYISRKLHEDYADVFDIEFLVGYNPDGSDRMLIKVKE